MNIPFDTTELHIKHLFSTQLKLPAGRVEDIRFEGDESHLVARAPDEANKISKRKRASSANNDYDEILERITFPPTWDRELRVHGRTAIVVFVDRQSMESVLKSARLVYEHKKYPEWGAGIEDKIPALGISS